MSEKDKGKTKKYIVKGKQKEKKDKTEKTPNKKKHLFWTLFKIGVILLLLAVLVGAGVVAGILSGFFGSDFTLTENELKVGDLNTEVYDKDGNHIYTLSGTEKRQWIDIGDMPDYLTTVEIAAKWGLKKRRVAILCEEGRIPGAYKLGANWAIPANAEKPTDARLKSGNYIGAKRAKTGNTEGNRDE